MAVVRGILSVFASFLGLVEQFDQFVVRPLLLFFAGLYFAVPDVRVAWRDALVAGLFAAVGSY